MPSVRSRRATLLSRSQYAAEICSLFFCKKSIYAAEICSLFFCKNFRSQCAAETCSLVKFTVGLFWHDSRSPLTLSCVAIVLLTTCSLVQSLLTLSGVANVLLTTCSLVQFGPGYTCTLVWVPLEQVTFQNTEQKKRAGNSFRQHGTVPHDPGRSWV